jgi:hypothetical protein
MIVDEPDPDRFHLEMILARRRDFRAARGARAKRYWAYREPEQRRDARKDPARRDQIKVKTVYSTHQLN